MQFASQTELEEWVGDGALLESTPLSIEAGLTVDLQLTRGERRYGLLPAIRISRVLTDIDERGWQGRVFSVNELVALGAEVSSGSVLIEDAAYEGEDGFLLLSPEPLAPQYLDSAVAPLVDTSALADEALWVRYILSGVV